jgi:restriction system protein
MGKLWIVRALGGNLIPFFIENNLVALGWERTNDFTSKNREYIKQELLKLYPESKKSIPQWTSFFENFVKNMQKDDIVLTYDSSLREYYIGKITSDYYYNDKLHNEFNHLRDVKWEEKTISRDLISNSTKNSLGSPLTLFSLSNDQKKEILSILKNDNIVKNDEEKEEETKELAGQYIENSHEVLKDKIINLSPDKMEELMKEILKAMGYIAKRRGKSLTASDQGVDIFASKDGLGLEDPRIFVEVKHREGKIGSSQLRSFIGGRKSGDRCIYLSTGGFSKDCLYEADRSNIPLSLLDIDKLADLVQDYYESFSAEGKALLPLKKIFIPI